MKRLIYLTDNSISLLDHNKKKKIINIKNIYISNILHRIPRNIMSFNNMLIINCDKINKTN